MTDWIAAAIQLTAFVSAAAAVGIYLQNTFKETDPT
jgi:hypothetical protein